MGWGRNSCLARALADDMFERLGFAWDDDVEKKLEAVTPKQGHADFKKYFDINLGMRPPLSLVRLWGCSAELLLPANPELPLALP